MARSQRNEKLKPPAYMPPLDVQFIWAAYKGDTEAVVRLLPELSREKIDLNCRDSAGNTALIRASMGNHEAVAHLLLHAGLDGSLVNLRGNGVVHFFARHGNVAMLKVLVLKHKLSYDALNCDGDTPLKLTHSADAKRFLQNPTADTELETDPA